MFSLKTHTRTQRHSEGARLLSVRGAFTDETDAVSAVEIVPVSIMDEAGTVLAFFMAMSPVIRLTRLPFPEST